jgi:hypothetical protein
LNVRFSGGWGLRRTRARQAADELHVKNKPPVGFEHRVGHVTCERRASRRCAVRLGR